MRINGDGQEVLYLAEGDNVRLGCPYILDPEDYGPNGLDIEWMQLNSDPSHRENVVSARPGVPLPLHFSGPPGGHTPCGVGRRADKQMETLNLPHGLSGNGAAGRRALQSQITGRLPPRAPEGTGGLRAIAPAPICSHWFTTR